jgi:hypothetical protein
MSQEIDLCQESNCDDSNGERPNTNTASVSSRPLSRKRRQDKDGSSNENSGPGNSTATGSVELVVELELADEVEVSVSPHKKRLVAGKRAQIVDGVEVIEQEIGSEHSEQTSRDDDGSVNKHSQKLSTSKPSNASGRQRRVSDWEDCLSELADYRKIRGHCNVPQRYSETPQLGRWVGNQRKCYKLHLEGKRSSMTLSRIQELECLSFEWGSAIPPGKTD